MDKFSAIKRINEYLGEEVCNEYNTYCKLSLVEDKGWRFDVLVRKFAKTDIYLLLRYWDGGIICMKIPQRRFGDPRRAFKSIWEDYVEIWNSGKRERTS